MRKYEEKLRKIKKKEEKEGKRMSIKDFNLGKDGVRRQGERTELKKENKRKIQARKMKRKRGWEGMKKRKDRGVRMGKEDGRNGRGQEGKELRMNKVEKESDKLGPRAG